MRYRIKSPENSKSGALAYESVLRQKLARGEPIIPIGLEKEQKEKKQPFKQFAWNWFQIYVKNNNKNSEIQAKKYILKKHIVPFFGGTSIDAITTLQVEQYKSKKTNGGFGKSTLNNHLTVLSTCLKTAQNWLNLDKLPNIQRLKAPPPKTDFLSHKESEKLLAHSTPGMWRDVIFTALKTGLRRAELKALKWEDINFENKILTVRNSWCEYKKGLDSTKSNRERYIPLTDGLYKMLLERRKKTGFIFRDETTKGFYNNRLNQEIRKACTKAGIKKVTCHELRHSFASQLAMSGAPLLSIKTLLGHSDIRTTMRYAHLSPSTLRDTVRLLDVPQDFGHYVGTPEKPSEQYSVSTNRRVF